MLLPDKDSFQLKPLDAETIERLNTYANTELEKKTADALNPSEDSLLEKIEPFKALLPVLFTKLESMGYITSNPTEPTQLLLDLLYFYEGVVEGRSLDLKQRLETFYNALGKLAQRLSNELHNAAPVSERGGVLKQWGKLTAVDELKVVLQIIFTPKRYDIIDAYYQGNQFSRSFVKEVTIDQFYPTSEHKREIEVASGLLQNHLDKLEERVTNLLYKLKATPYSSSKKTEINNEIRAIQTTISAIKNDSTIYDIDRKVIIIKLPDSFATKSMYDTLLETLRGFYTISSKKNK